MTKKLLKLNFLLIMAASFLTGCDRNKLKSGTYYGSTGTSTFIFYDDGTCTLEKKYFNATITYTGTYFKSDGDNIYEIKLVNTGSQYFAEITADGCITITSCFPLWNTEVYSSERPAGK